MAKRTSRYILIIALCISISAGVYFVRVGEFRNGIYEDFQELNFIGSTTAVPNPPPQPIPETSPDPIPTINSETEPGSELEVDTTLIPIPESQPAPALTTKPEPKPETKSKPEPTPVPAQESKPVTTVEPITEQTMEPEPEPEPVPQPVAFELTQAEQQMLNLINKEREGRGLPLLQMDIELTKAARLKSQDMIDFNYFAHESPTYGSPFEMMKSFGIDYRYAAENIAGSRTVEKAHANLMNSSGHKANILDSRYTQIGIGIKSGGTYGMIFTQMFIGK